jgi:hypothetical protein
MRLLSLLLTLGLCAAAGPAAGQTPPAPTTEDCLACHEDASATRADGTSVAVAANVFADSIHGGLACVDCHQDLAAQTEWPHPEKLGKVNCATCHEEPVAKYGDSVHAKARREHPESKAATCVDCHGMHDIKPSAEPTSRTYHLNLPETCGRCHADVKVMPAELRQTTGIVAQFQDSTHGKALMKSGLTVAPDCVDCHNSHDIKPPSEPASTVHRQNVPGTCGKCHEGIRTQFAKSIHGTRLAAGSVEAPACADCHTAHGVTRAENPTWRLQVVEECGLCHVDKLQTYRDTFHGQVTALGFERVAKCSDCHGAHDIHPMRDPASRVASANLVKTCSKCHENANDNFVKYDPHADKHDRERNPTLYYSARFMGLLLAGTFTFFGVHTGLWFMRALKARKEGR